LGKPKSPFEALMQLECHGPDTYVGSGPSYPWGGLYGGQIVAQALRAAGLTVEPDHLPHSLHAYFLRVGDPEEPVRFEVERLRDGRSFVARQVEARQSTGAILNMSASFQAAGTPTMDVQLAEVPDVGPPAEAWDVSWSPVFELRLVPGDAAAESVGGLRAGSDAGGDVLGRQAPATGSDVTSSEVKGNAGSGRAIGVGILSELSDPRRAHMAARRLGGHLHRAEGLQKACSWSKVLEDLGEDRALHAAALAYISDSGPASVAAALHAHECEPAEPWRPVSLDHAIWFHRPFRADDWLLFEASTASLSDSRGLTQGRVFSREGSLVASIAQEVFLRRPRATGA
jgi:acyl-CoA thioesterase II